MSDQGQVYSVRRGIILRPVKNTDGYLRVTLCVHQQRKGLSIHRLVARAFAPNPHALPQVNHINGDKEDNRAENLEWVTGPENHQHAARTGLKASKLGVEEVRRIRRQYQRGVLQRTLGRMFGVGQPHISRIVRRVYWAHVP